ncbi:MAG: HipA domain-containing protein [Spirochaetaceae bacterium]
MQYQLENRCLYCYNNLEEAENLYHNKCAKKFFGTITPPEIDYSTEDLADLAAQFLESRTTVTGVQPKLSLGIKKSEVTNSISKFTIMGIAGNYILKPQSEVYPELPELEDLTMHLAKISKIETVNHALIPLKSGELAYITKRVDRVENKKLHMEDMCQLTERLTEQKYMGSYEQISKIIKKYSANPILDIVNFYEVVLFSFLTGNNDMHLKNFSLLKKITYCLCPAYDLVPSELVVIGDDEELALNLNGKKKRLKKVDFEKAMLGSGLPEKTINNMFLRFRKVIPKWILFIEKSFLSDEFKKSYIELINNKLKQIGI